MKKIEIDLLDIALSNDKSYYKYNEKLTRLLRARVSVKKDDLVKELRGVMEKDIEEKLIDQVDEYSSDEEVIKLYSKYTKAELERNTLIEEAKEIALEEGFKQGIEQEKNNIVKNMLKENISDNIISNVTGLNIDEINKIKNDK